MFRITAQFDRGSAAIERVVDEFLDDHAANLVRLAARLLCGPLVEDRSALGSSAALAHAAHALSGRGRHRGVPGLAVTLY
jgi:hypothetical protein